MNLKEEFEKKPGNEVHNYPSQAHTTRNEPQNLENMENLCLFLSIIIVVVTLPLSLLFIFKMAYQYERVVILRLGKVRKGGPRGPGLYLYMPCVDESTKLDLRTLVFQLDPQQVLTKDSCTIQIDVIIFCRIVDPVKTVVAVSDLRVATLNLASTILRNIIGQKDLSEFLSQKDAVALALKRVLDAGTYPWGVKVLRVEIMGIRLPTNMQRAMASEAEATREAKAKMIFAEGELLASKALTEASDIMVDNPVTIHLRYLQTLMVVSADKNSTIIFPLPTDLLKKYVKPYLFSILSSKISKHIFNFKRPRNILNYLPFLKKWDIAQEKLKQHDLRYSSNGGVKCAETVCLLMSILCIIILFPLSLFFCFRIVKQFERAVILRFGKLRKGLARGPGLIFIIVCIDNVIKVDLRTVTYAIPPQEVLTKDSCTVSVDAVVYYSVRDSIKAVVQVSNFRYSTCVLAATILRNIMGQKNLTEILSERESIALVIKEVLDLATEPWGVWVERIEIKDVRLPVQMQRAMAAEAEATREARAKVIAAEGELRAARNLKEASDIIAKNPTALQLRYLQTLNSIASERNSTIIFPLPVDLVSAFGK